MAWLILIIAGLLEIAWASGLPATEGFTRPLPSILVGVAIAASMLLLSIAARTLPIGTAYAVWVGIGAAGTAVAGILFHGESATLQRVTFLALLVVAVIGLRLTSSED